MKGAIGWIIFRNRHEAYVVNSSNTKYWL